MSMSMIWFWSPIIIQEDILNGIISPSPIQRQEKIIDSILSTLSSLILCITMACVLFCTQKLQQRRLAEAGLELVPIYATIKILWNVKTPDIIILWHGKTSSNTIKIQYTYATATHILTQICKGIWMLLSKTQSGRTEWEEGPCVILLLETIAICLLSPRFRVMQMQLRIEKVSVFHLGFILVRLVQVGWWKEFWITLQDHLSMQRFWETTLFSK